jgi:hypothetical protein
MRGLPYTLRLVAGGLFLIGVGFVLRGDTGQTQAAFSGSASNGSNLFAAAADWVAPTAGSTIIAKTAGGAGGAIKPSATYYVYANVTDAGNPASGTSTVTSDVSSVTAGQTAANLTSGSYTVNGVSFNYRSASLTAGALAPGSYAYTLAPTDVATNTRTQSGFSVTIDSTVPSASDIQIVNGGPIAGRPDIGDVITYTFSEPMDPNSILAGWTGVSQNIVVRVNNVGGSDTVTIYNSTNVTLLPFGTVNAGSTAYVTANRTFGASGTPSTMVMSGNVITVTIGTQSGAGATVAGNTTAAWTPSATATDVAANAMSTTVRNETGAADQNF